MEKQLFTHRGYLACLQCYHVTVILLQEWPNYGPQTSFIRPAKYLAHFFKYHVPTVDSSATALAAAGHVNRTVSGLILNAEKLKHVYYCNNMLYAVVCLGLGGPEARLKRGPSDDVIIISQP